MEGGIVFGAYEWSWNRNMEFMYNPTLNIYLHTI